MSQRFRCPSCRASFVSEEVQAGRQVVCPKCGGKHAAAAPVRAVPISDPESSVFVAADGRPKPRRLRRLAWGALSVLVLGGVALAVAWPSLKRWWRPVPPDPVESVASAYLKALAEGDSEASRRLGTVELPPAIRTFRAVHRDRTRDERLKGSFAPISAFHARVDETYAYDPAIGRYTPRNALGAAAETLDVLHAAKAESEDIAKKIRSGDPNDLFDAAEAMAKPYAALAEGVLAPKKLIPTYKMLVEDAKPPLPSVERALALDYASHRETWDALLKRPFVTLKADGPFLLEKAEVTTSVVDALGSLGDPPTTLHLTLTRFRLEGIDTGWKVTSTRREGQPEESAPPALKEPPTGPTEATGTTRPY